MKKLDFNPKDSPFYNFLSSRYSMTAKVNVEDTWNYSKENDLSFFICSLGCLIKGLNSIPQLRRRIINNKAVEFESLDGVSPIMDEKNKVYKEMRVSPPDKYKSFIKWHDYVKNTSKNILEGKEESFNVEMSKRDYESIANFSCIPWVDFESITNCVFNSNQIQPLITWGKVNKDYNMAVSLTVSHIFVNGKELALFFNFVQKNFNNLK